MKKRQSDTAEPRLFLHDILFGAAGVLLLLVMVTLWLICGMFAKYVVTDEASDYARVAAFRTVEVLEHGVVLKDGEYRLLNDTHSKDYSEVTENTYSKVIPGVDIPKDPFVRLNETTEVDCELYLKVIEKDFPTYEEKIPAISFNLTDYWEEISSQSGHWVYKSENVHVFDALNVDETKQIITFALTDAWALDESISDANNSFYTYKDSLITAPATLDTFVQTHKAITYRLTDDWMPVERRSDDKKGIYFYKYQYKLDANTTVSDIPILQKIGDSIDGTDETKRELQVSEYYNGFDEDGKPIEFNLTFSVWLVQVD